VPVTLPLLSSLILLHHFVTTMNPIIRFASLTAAILSLALTVISAPVAQPESYNAGVALLERRWDPVDVHLGWNPVHHIENAHGDPNTWKGHLPAHTTNAMTPGDLNKYAKHMHNKIMAQSPYIAPDFVVAATHRPGDNVVHFHTQPKGSSHFAHAQGNFPHMDTAMRNNGLTTVHQTTRTVPNPHHPGHFMTVPHAVTVPFHHAETAAIRHSLESRGADHTNAAAATQGHVVGVHGYVHVNDHNGQSTGIVETNRPCHNCRNTLNAMGVHH
jgi:hypothetical protein